MAKLITITIDMSGRTWDSQGEVGSTPNVSVSAHGLDTAADSAMLGKLHEAVISIVKPQPVNS